MLTLQNTDTIRRIEEAIGYTFNDKRLLLQVLTRKTYLKIDPEAPDNEVLEFYGDTLMNYHVTNYFMSKYAHMLDDGLFFMRTVEQFTDMRSHYVCNRYLTDRVKALGLARHLRAQNRDAELRRDGEKAYADVFESLVGAIYLDSCQNDTLIRAFILRQLGIEPKCLPADIEAFNYDSLVTPLSEEADSVLPEEAEPIVSTPEIEFIPSPEPTTEEAPAPVLMTEESTATPIESAAMAETDSSSSGDDPEPPALPVTIPEPAVTAVTVFRPNRDALAAFCEEHGYDQPTYGEPPKNAPNARPVAACTLKYKDARGKTVKISLNDSGRTLAEATEKAAAKMLKKLETQVADKKEKATDKSAEAIPAEIEVEKVEAAAQRAEAITPEMPVPEMPVPEMPVPEMPVPEMATPETPAVEAVAAEETAETVEPVAEVASAAETPTEGLPIAEFPAEDAPTVEPAETVPVEDETPVLEAGAVPESSSAVEEVPVAEVAPDAEEAPVEEFIQQTMVLNVDSLSADASATEDAKPAKAPRKKKTEAADGSDKPAKKTPSKKKTAPKEDKPAEELPVTETPIAETEEGAEKISETPAKEAKPRRRAPRAKKQETVSEVSAEGGQGQTE